MKNNLVKFIAGLAALLLFVALVYVLMNLSYFWKQVNYSWRKPDPTQTVSNNANQLKGEPNHLSIPSLGIDAPIVEPAGKKETDFQEALKSGVVHYPGTANVGEVGNAYIFGHSSDFAFKGGSFKTVFALLPRIQNGAEIDVTNANGDKFIYKVEKQMVVSSNDTSVLSQETNGSKQLTLQTSYPVGTALKRYIVIALPAE